jgi:hypothetical protein
MNIIDEQSSTKIWWRELFQERIDQLMQTGTIESVFNHIGTTSRPFTKPSLSIRQQIENI